jgi:DNA-binding transcriptional LysR family regulator
MIVMHQMDELPDLELLSLFASLHREKHLTRAALRAGRSQPAMSRALERMRKAFADPLFVRTPSGMVPTARADALAPEITRVLESARALVLQEAFEPSALVRTFVIATSDLVEANLLEKLTRRVSREAPRVDLLLRPIAAETAGDLVSGRVDLVIAPEVSLPRGLIRQHLFDDHFVCAVREGHPIVRRALSLEQYCSLLHIQIAPRGEPGGPVDDALAAKGLSRRVAVRTGSFLAAPLLVARSDYLLTAPRLMLEPLAKPLGLRIHPPPLEIPGYRIHQAWHPRSKSDLAHKWFRALVRATQT